MSEDILDKIADLHKQATTERSHYYVAGTLAACAAEITQLRAKIKRRTAERRPWQEWPCAPPDEHKHKRWHWLLDDEGQPFLAEWAGTSGFGWHMGWSGSADDDDMTGWRYLGPVELPNRAGGIR